MEITTNPGGGWRSAKHFGCQEESLCKRSNLGLLLEKKSYPIPNNGQHYLPEVIIDKDKNFNKITPIKCGIIASELKAIYESKESYLEMKVLNLYQIAVDNSYDAIVLGAWGCGAFSETDQDAEIICRHFKKCQKRFENRIKTVFAIPNKKYYKIFKKVFDEN